MGILIVQRMEQLRAQTMMFPEQTSGLVLQTASDVRTKHIEFARSTSIPGRGPVISPGDTYVVQDGNGMETLVESLVERTEPSSTKPAERRSLRRLHEKSPKSPLLGGIWEGTGAPTFWLAG
jgi:hypothetical protein